jgi:hypothetical protein
VNLARTLRIAVVVGALAAVAVVPAGLAIANAVDDQPAVAAATGAADAVEVVDPEGPGVAIEDEVKDEDDKADGKGIGVVEFGHWFGPPTEPDIAEMQAEAQALADFLAERGIDTDVVEVPVVTWDMTDPEANEAVKEFYAERGLPFFDGELFEFDGEFPFDEFPFDGEGFEFAFGLGAIGQFPPMDMFPGLTGTEDLPAEIVEVLNEEAAVIAAALEQAGVEHETTVEGGVTVVTWDGEDEAARKVVDDHLQGRVAPLMESLLPLLPGIADLEEFDGDFGFEFVVPEEFGEGFSFDEEGPGGLGFFFGGPGGEFFFEEGLPFLEEGGGFEIPEELLDRLLDELPEDFLDELPDDFFGGFEDDAEAEDAELQDA